MYSLKESALHFRGTATFEQIKSMACLKRACANCRRWVMMGGRMRRVVIVNDKMQQGYRYELSEPAGCNFDPPFRPDLTPKQMLELGVFCGKYLTDCRDEFPASWFARAKLSPSGRDCSLNYFGVDASQPLSEWRRKGFVTLPCREREVSAPQELSGRRDRRPPRGHRRSAKHAVRLGRGEMALD